MLSCYREALELSGDPIRLTLAGPGTFAYRGAGFGAVWPQFIALDVIGTVLFGIALTRFRKTIGQMRWFRTTA